MIGVEVMREYINLEAIQEQVIMIMIIYNLRYNRINYLELNIILLYYILYIIYYNILDYLL